MKNDRRLLRYRGKRCLNCQQELDKSEQFCHNCGQLNSTKKLRFDDFFNEFFAGIFAYDARFHRTLTALLFRPGKISKDYIEGKRQRYANPYRFYLSASILFFILFGLLNEISIGDPASIDNLDEDSITAVDSVMTSEGLGTFNLDLQEKTFDDIYVPESSLDSLSYWSSTSEKLKLFSKFHKETEITQARVALDSLKYKPTSYNRWLYEKTIDINLISSNPGLFLNYFLGKLPFIIFFFLPLFALFIWLLYARRPYTYMEHLIFAFHVQTVWFVLYGFAIILNNIFNSSLPVGITTIIFLFYLYRALRGFYGQTRVKTFLKFILLNGIFFILAFIAAVFSLIASLAIF